MSGSGTVPSDGTEHAVGAGDVVLHPPGEAHQILNTGSEDLLYLIVDDNPPLDVCRYPDSGKWGVFRPSSRHLFRATDVDYWEGEE
jgi:uncharacterized cupin superfamily protein